MAMAARPGIAGWSGERRVENKPVNLVADRVAAGLDPAVLGVGAGVGQERAGRVGEAPLDLGQHQRPVGLQREQPVPAARVDQRRGLALAVDGVSGDQNPGQVEQAEQGAGGGDRVAARRHRRLARHQPRLAGEGGDNVQGGTARRTVEGPA
jgi:hypothetical protein